MTKSVNGGVNRIESAADITLLLSKGANKGAKSFQDNPNTSKDESNPNGYIEVPISRLDTSKEIEISEVRESSLKANGYSITSISYSGTMMFKGSRLTKEVPDKSMVETTDGDSDIATKDKPLEQFLYDNHGVPVPVSIEITHDKNNESERYEHVLVTSDSYEVRNEETTETAFDWVAMDRKSDQPTGG